MSDKFFKGWFVFVAIGVIGLWAVIIWAIIQVVNHFT